ncbi:MAG: HPr family phosphocarrier protein [Filifactor alocis]|nr:HPr family phosphocarrier protein [Filifactor alocis]
MLVNTFEIKSKSGLHARPAALFVQECNNFESEIEIRKGQHRVNGKSIIGVMALAVEAGESIEVFVEGPDEEEAMKAIETFLAKQVD